MNSSAGLAFTPHIIRVGVGEDVAAKILAFAKQRPKVLCILSANGSVSAVSLSHPAASGGCVTYEESSICYDAEIVETINSMIVDHGSSPKLEDIDGPKTAKKALHQMVILPAIRRDLFAGIREQTKGLLLFGPPSTETTMAMLAKAAASESEATFFNVSASSLTSELFGEGSSLFELCLRSPFFGTLL